MKFDDLKANWKAEIASDKRAQDLTLMIKLLAKETSKVDKSIKRRDTLEISIALLLIPVWSWKLFYAASLVQSIGLWIAILACLFIPYKLIKAKRVNAPKDSSVMAFWQVEKVKIENQVKLLESIAVWYLFPLMLAIVLITAGATVDGSGVPRMTEQLAIYYGFCALLNIGVYFLNKRAVKKQLLPLLDKIKQRISELNELKEI
ncbi:hypothetical protein [Paraglaciecola arctica]|uniref:hypothetical protein n=1 Tax=Paraglaciecola arctica TaxID=1128911 RepID=UPI001C06C16C|nr:hypothetical protein [Paraglaciecola arctica]MBU3005528.1 hypothetical protein [Paraglaciecola arctica]